ncbi:sensor histidine kinase [Desulfobacter postgatei]
MESSVAGVYTTEKGPLLVASRPVIRSLHQGPAKGYLIMGRFLNEAYMKILTDQTKVDHRYWLSQDPSIPAESRSIFERVQKNSGPVFEEQDKSMLFVYNVFKGLTSSSDLIIRAEIPRQIMKYAKNTMFLVLISTVLAGFTLLFVMFFLLNQVVIDPLGKLTAWVVSLESAKPTLFPFCLNRNDEIGILCFAFQTLFNKLTQVHKNLQEINLRLNQETRTLTFEISPPILYELGLKPALEWLLETTCREHGIDTFLEGDLEGDRLDNSLSILIFRTVRELLHNIIKHANASETTVRLSQGANFFEICVTDNGIGFDPEKQYKNIGFGLFSIRERFSSIGGEFSILSKSGEGTRAILKVPYNLKHTV